jgi:soluble lytic murein transglycosylase
MTDRSQRLIVFWLGFAAGAALVVLSPLWPTRERSISRRMYEDYVEPSVTVMSRERIREVKSRYGSIVRNHAQNFNVDPDLVMAVLLAESAGKPRAKSPAGARGLMQLMPATARELAAELGMSGPNLYDPDTNIELGTYYLAKMMAPSYRLDFGDLGDFGGLSGGGFDYQLELVLAAYNAGPGNVRKWIRGRSASGPAAVVRKAGVSETRKYVARVKKYMEILKAM